MSTDYETLNDALANIARRSFYEDATVIPLRGGRYRVTDADRCADGASDGVGWTYADGLDVSTIGGIVDHSRLHDAAEIYDDARHVRRNLPATVEALKRGEPVTFAYVVAHDDDATHDDASGDYVDSDGESTDGIAGWLLVAVEGGYETDTECDNAALGGEPLYSLYTLCDGIADDLEVADDIDTAYDQFERAAKFAEQDSAIFGLEISVHLYDPHNGVMLAEVTFPLGGNVA